MRTGIYVRVSTTEQNKSGYSVGEQEKRLRSYCDAKGWDVVRLYVDGGYSGKDMDRPALQDMLRDIEEGRVEAVLVYKLDRLSRSQRDTMALIEDVFLPAGIDFVSMTEDLNTSTPVGMAMIGLLAVFAQMERSVIAERMAVGIEGRAKDGYYHGNKCSPVGYDYVDGELVVIPYEAMMVREAFEELVARKPIGRICREFEEKGYRHRYGPFLPRSMKRMFQKKLYAGYIEKDGESYPGRHEAIVPEELFLDAQRVLDERASNGPSFKANSILAGLVHCKRCGAKYCRVLGHRKQDGTKSEFYVCYSRNKKVPAKVADPNCKNRIWRCMELDGAVFGEITKLGIDPSFIEQAMAGASDAGELERRAALIEERVADLTEQITRTTQLFTISGLDVAEVKAQLDPLTSERQALRLELEALREDVGATVEETYELARSFGDVLERGDFDEVRFAVEQLVEKVVVDGEEVRIHWKFA